MLILEKFPDDTRLVRLEDGREVTLSVEDKNGDYEVYDSNGNTIGLMQCVTGSTTKYIYVFIEYSPDNSKVSMEEINYTPQEALEQLRLDYDWVTWETEGGQTMGRLFELNPDPDQLKNLFDTIGSRSKGERIRRWNVVRKFIFLIDNPESRGTSASLKFWLDKCLPLLKILKITL